MLTWVVLLSLLSLISFSCADPFLLTVIKIKANHTRGEEMFLNGGFDPGNMAGCSNKAEPNNQCCIPIRHNHPSATAKILTDDHKRYDAYAFHDNFLDWYGGEDNQGSYKGKKPLGTPMFWLPSNNTNSTAKSGIWVAELLMDCGRTHSGQKWFEFRPIRREVNGQVIKTELVPYGAVSDLNGGAAGLAYFPPWDAGNYWGICGRTTIAELNLPGTKLSHLKI